MKISEALFRNVFIAVLLGVFFAGCGGGEDGIEKLEASTIEIDRDLSFTVNAGMDLSIRVNETINIMGVVSKSNETIVRYEWKNDLITLSTSASFYFSSASEGVYVLTLTVTDDKGAIVNDSVKITVANPTDDPVAEPTNDPVTEPTDDPVAEPTDDPVAEPTNDPVTEPTDDPVTEPTGDPVTEPTDDPVDVNQAPVAKNITVNIYKNSTKTITLKGTDADGNTLSYHKVSDPAQGIVEFNGSNAIYTPSSDFTGNDGFIYKVNDGKVDSSNAFVFINISDYPEHTKSFSTAKREATEIYLAHQEAFYSGCEYHAVEKKLVPLLSTCGYQTRKNEVRASRIEWEHVVSMWAMAHEFECWIDGGRSNCKGDKYRKIETDLHNLVPSIGEINGDRSNYWHGIIAGESRVYGVNVDAEVDFKARVFEPRESVRGDIARMYFYMQQKYGLSLSSEQLGLLSNWDKCDEVDDWEKERNLAIEAIQGNANPFISNYISNASGCKDDSGSSLEDTGNSNNDSTSDTGSSNSDITLSIESQSCDTTKKYCYHMESCSDAYYYFNQCGRTRLDGDKDGVPCEALCN